MSVLMGLIGMIGWGVYDFAGGVMSRRLGAIPVLLWSQVAGCTIIAVGVMAAAVATADGQAAELPDPQVLALALLASSLYCGGYLFFFRGFEKGQISIVAATMNAWAVVTMTVAFIFFDQRLNPVQTIGAAAIIAGGSLACLDWRQVAAQGVRLSLGVKEALAGAVLFGLYWNVSEYISEAAGWLATTVLVKTGIVAILLARLLAGRAARSPRPTRTAWSPRLVAVLVLMGLVEVGAVAAVNYGLVVGDAILTTPIASALSVVTIALAVALLGERVSWPQGLGIAIALAGIVTTSL